MHLWQVLTHPSPSPTLHSRELGEPSTELQCGASVGESEKGIRKVTMGQITEGFLCCNKEFIFVPWTPGSNCSILVKKVTGPDLCLRKSSLAVSPDSKRSSRRLRHWSGKKGQSLT